MDCIAVWDGEKVIVKEFRHLKVGDLVFTGREEDGSKAYLYTCRPEREHCG